MRGVTRSWSDFQRSKALCLAPLSSTCVVRNLVPYDATAASALSSFFGVSIIALLPVKSS